MDLGGGALELPPGFRFHPTDEELVNYYLCRKCGGLPIAAPVITEVDLYKFEPWKLPEKAVGGQDSKEWYFFSPRDRKYPNGSRPNRAAGTGYWKATGADKPVGSPRAVAIKKALVFYAGKPPNGVKTNWIMHEYRLADVDRSAAARKKSNNALRLDDWVLCRIYNKKGVIERYDTVDSGADEAKPAAAPPARNPRSGHYPVVPAMKIELSDYGFYQHPSLPATEMLCFDRSGTADRDSDPRSPLLHTDSSSSDRSQHSPSPDFPSDMDYAESPHPAAGFGGGGWSGDDWGCGIEDDGFAQILLQPPLPHIVVEMYHPTRGGVRGGRDQFKWDDVKVDKHRENYLGHSVKAPVGRWQKGKDLLWYTRDKKSDEEDAMKEEIRRVKEEEEQAMREALGLAPKRSSRPKGNRLDKHEYAELIKRGSTAEDLGAGHAEAAQVQGLGLYKGPQHEEEPSSPGPPETNPEQVEFAPATKQEDSEDDRKGKRRRDDERRGDREKGRKHENHSGGKERRREKHDSRHDSEDREKRRRKDKQKRRHDSD